MSRLSKEMRLGRAERVSVPCRGESAIEEAYHTLNCSVFLRDGPEKVAEMERYRGAAFCDTLPLLLFNAS
jgi:hypothetical protein